MRLALYYLVILVMVAWAAWTGFTWLQLTHASDTATEIRITRTWPQGKRQMELRERIREAQEDERRKITTRMILQGGLGLVVLHLVSLGLKERSTG